ncbi:Beta-galactosidase [Spironucleus salmonicida]|uniref:Beta-galactosidase n=1 Tax=Spironucleus salmonicida TaxID=348837 RepID=V6LKI8_9EUKA|nr:Beta-galactosidase [Spironucleus salmonicida]|eukprot:EST44236.1 Beta-galactosidase [Spironucleus salmonicida]
MLIALSIFGWNRTQFTLDDQEFQIVGGAIDLIRIPHQYWENRIISAKTMGINTMVVQLNWNAIEQADGSLDFTTEQNNLSNFIQLCKKHDLQLILRPGPQSHYYTAIGGVPIRMHYINVSSRDVNDKVWVAGVSAYIQAVSEIVKKNVENVAMIQLDQLTGLDSVSGDYLRLLRQLYISNGIFGPFTLLESATKLNNLQGAAIGLSGSVEQYEVDTVQKSWPHWPVYYGNKYTGGATTYLSDSPKQKILRIQDELKNKQSMIFFPICGGTSFGLEAGGISSMTYDAYTTSNDFGAPLTENGYPTPSFLRLQKQIKGSNEDKVDVLPMQSVQEFTMKKVGTIEAQNFVSKGTFVEPPTFESQNQREGMGIYEIQITPNSSGIFSFEKVRDYAQIYLDGELIHTFDRQQDVSFNYLIEDTKSGLLKIVVDTSGHSGFPGYSYTDDLKGLWGLNLFNNSKMTNFKLSLLDIENFKPVEKLTEGSFIGGLFQGQFTANQTDTYLDLKNFKKGYVFVNGINIGRYWNVKDDQSKNHYSRMYCPGVYLKSGINEITVLDVISTLTQVQVAGFELAFACPAGQVEHGQECNKE